MGIALLVIFSLAIPVVSAEKTMAEETCLNCNGSGTIEEEYSYTVLDDEGVVRGIISKRIEVSVSIRNYEEEQGIYGIDVTVNDDEGNTYMGSTQDIIPGNSIVKLSVTIDVERADDYWYEYDVNPPTRDVMCPHCDGSGTVEEEDGNGGGIQDIPGFTTMFLLVAVVTAVLIYRKKNR